MFSCEYCEIFKNTYFEEHLRTAASVLNPPAHEDAFEATLCLHFDMRNKMILNYGWTGINFCLPKRSTRRLLIICIFTRKLFLAMKIVERNNGKSWLKYFTIVSTHFIQTIPTWKACMVLMNLWLFFLLFTAIVIIIIISSSMVIYRTVVLIYFVQFPAKNTCDRILLNKSSGNRSTILFKEAPSEVFFGNFAKFFGTVN